MPPDALGFTLCHEHLFGQPPSEYAEDDLCLEDEASALHELQDFKGAGGAAVVEMTTPDYGRNVAVLERLSRQSGVHIVAATGFNKAKFADRYSSRLTEDALVEWMATEVSEGVTEPPSFVADVTKGSRTAARAGLIKASSSLGGPTKDEEKVMRAAARAHHKTGAPVSTHTEKATWALEQAAFLLERGVNPGKLLIGHLDFNPDLAYLSEMAGLGVYLGLDQFSKDKYLPDARRVELVIALTEKGFGEQLLLSGDLARRSYWRTFGGAGFRHLPTTIKQHLREAGMTEAGLEQLFVHNPRNWLDFSV